MNGSRARALAPYPDPEAREREFDALVAELGGEIEVYGASVEGRPLRVAKLPAADPAAPRVLCCANIHGPEFVGNRVAIGLLRALGEAEGPAAKLRQRASVWCAPCVNPDGYARTWERRGVGPLASLRPNANGVDLNRNFPLPQGRRPSRLPFTGSPDPGAATFRGTAPLSEPETKALEDLFRAGDFHASANLHSFMGTLIPPRVSVRDHFDTYVRLCHTFQRAQPTRRYRRLGSWIFDTYTGEQEDHQHAVHGTWALCVESFPVLASFRQHVRTPSTFWRFNPIDPAPWVANDVPGIIAWLSAALDLPRPNDEAGP